MNTRTAILLSTLAFVSPAIAQQAPGATGSGATPASAPDPHAGHMPGMSAPATPAGGSATAPATGGATMGHSMMHGGTTDSADTEHDGKPDAQDPHAAMGHGAGAGGMGGGMGGCKKMGGGMGGGKGRMMGHGMGGMMGGAPGGAEEDDAFHRDLVARLDRLENRLILLETLLRERLRAQ